MADVREIGGELRREYDRLVHQVGGDVIGEAEHTAINAALAAANNVATSGALGYSGVGVVISGHTDAAGRTGTVSIALSSIEIDPPAIGPVESRPEARFRHTLEEPVSTTNPFGPGGEITEPRGQTDSAAFLAAQAEAEAIERDRNDDEQIRARREEELKLQRQARERGTIDGADIVLGPERRPNDPVTQAQEERDRAMVLANDPTAFTAGDASQGANAAFLEHQDSANPDATGERVPTPDGGTEAIRSEDLLAQSPPGAEGTVADPRTVVEEVTGVPAELTHNALEGEPVEDTPETAPAADPLDDIDDPGEVTKDRLQELCDENNLPRSGTKAELLARLHEAGITVADS
jgi:hypothetical protein